MPFTLAHLSDVHLSPVTGFTPLHWNVKRALGYANWMAGRRHVHRRATVDLMLADIAIQAPDHIAVTGDLVNLGLPAEYKAAARWLATVGPPDRVSVVPGNHDIYTRLRTDPGIARWQDYMRSDAWGARLAPSGFPYVRRVRETVLIGLNSAHPTQPFVAAGRLGPEQLDALARILDALADTDLARVVLIHHPPLPGQASPRRALADAVQLAAVLAAHGADLVLHGHNHRDMAVLAGGHIPVIGVASGSAAVPHKHEPTARWNYVQIGPRSAAGRCPVAITVRGLTPSGAVDVVTRQSWP